MGTLLGFLLKKEVGICVAQLSLAYNNASKDSQLRRVIDSDGTSKLVGRVFGSAVESVYEILLADRFGEENCKIHIEHDVDQSFERARSSDTAILALSAHLGCFELIAAYYAAKGISLTTVGRDPNYGLLGEMLRELRGSYGVTALWRGDRSAIRDLKRALVEGHVLATLIDQDTSLESGFAKFFGVEAASPIVPVKLALSRKLPICTSFVVRTAPLHHRIITRWVDYQPDDPNALENILQVYSDRLEELVLQYPEQWVWWHRRWRRRPGVDYVTYPQMMRSTKDYIEWLADGAVDIPSSNAQPDHSRKIKGQIN